MQAHNILFLGSAKLDVDHLVRTADVPHGTFVVCAIRYTTLTTGSERLCDVV